MKFFNIVSIASIFLTTFFLGSYNLWAKTSSMDKSSGSQPDNTGRNKEIVESGSPTAMQQSNDKSDIDLVAKIRKAVVKDKSLSTNAHNVKIVTNKGSVQVIGPVANEDEKKALERIVSKYVEPQKIKMNVDITNK